MSIKDEGKRYNRLIELNVQEQCVNLIKTAAVQQANKERGLQVHGWVYGLHNGLIKDLGVTRTAYDDEAGAVPLR